MHVYPMRIVYHFYEKAVNEKNTDFFRFSSVLQLVGYTARDLSKKGSDTVADGWKKLLSAFEPSKKKRKLNAALTKDVPKIVPKDNSEKAVKGASAANAFMGGMRFSSVT